MRTVLTDLHTRYLAAASAARSRSPSAHQRSGVEGFLLVSLIRKWKDNAKGILPGPYGMGRSEQNPVLMAAFAVLDNAEAQAEAAGAGN